ncbi:HAD-IA family hydrolase [Escherichia coli]
MCNDVSGIWYYADPEEVFKRFKGVKLYEIIDIVSLEHGVTLAKTEAEHVYRAEVAGCSIQNWKPSKGLERSCQRSLRQCAWIDGRNNKMQHSMASRNMLHYFPDKSFSGYDIQRWKPDPASMFNAAKAMNVNVENCILVDDSVAGAQSGIDAGMEVFYFCANRTISRSFTRNLPPLPIFRSYRNCGKRVVGILRHSSSHSLHLPRLNWRSKVSKGCLICLFHVG